jgi:hypothetical protein
MARLRGSGGAPNPDGSTVRKRERNRFSVNSDLGYPVFSNNRFRKIEGHVMQFAMTTERRRASRARPLSITITMLIRATRPRKKKRQGAV